MPNRRRNRKVNNDLTRIVREARDVLDNSAKHSYRNASRRRRFESPSKRTGDRFAQSSPGDLQTREVAREMAKTRNSNENNQARLDYRGGKERSTPPGETRKPFRGRQTQLQSASEKPDATPQSAARTGRQKSEESHLIKALRAAIEKAHNE